MKTLRWLLLVQMLAYCTSARTQGIMLPVSHYAVQGAPFTVTLEIRSDSQGIGTVRISRDAAGRQRYEPPMINGVSTSSHVGIYDVVAGKYILLDLKAKTAEISPMRLGRPVAMDVSTATSLPPSTPAADQTLLGTQTIAGFEAWGQKTVKTFTRSDGVVITQDRELWISTHYRMPVKQVLRTNRDVQTQTVAAFDPSEPDPALFQIPPGFVSHDAPPPPEPIPGTVRIGGNVSPPRVLKTVDPSFSKEARQKKISGDVMVRLVVDENGLPQNVTVVRGLGSGLDEKAVEAVKQYKFKPAMREGVPVKVELNIAVNFQIF